MANRRDTFAKRQRETELKDRARAKQERRVAKRNEPRTTKGPQIAWDEATPAAGTDGAAGVAGAAPTTGSPPTAEAASDDVPEDPNPTD